MTIHPQTTRLKMPVNGIALQEKDRNHLADERQRRGLSSRATAKIIGVSGELILRIETGKVNPSAKVLASLCELYELRYVPGYLVRDNQNR